MDKPRFEGNVFNLKYGDTPWTGTELKETGKSSFQGKVKEKWGKLTDDDLTAINGKRDQLALLWHFRLPAICKDHVTVRTSPGWRSREEIEDRLPDGWHAWLWWRS